MDKTLNFNVVCLFSYVLKLDRVPLNSYKSSTGHPGFFFFVIFDYPAHTTASEGSGIGLSRHLRLSDYVCSFFQNNYWYALRFPTTSWCSQLYYFLAFYICEFQFLFQHVYCSFIINLYWLSMINLIMKNFDHEYIFDIKKYSADLRFQIPIFNYIIPQLKYYSFLWLMYCMYLLFAMWLL